MRGVAWYDGVRGRRVAVRGEAHQVLKGHEPAGGGAEAAVAQDRERAGEGHAALGCPYTGSSMGAVRAECGRPPCV